MSLGEGACSEGEFWESLNATTLLRLPLLYVVADNGWAISVPASEQAAAPVSELVAGFPGLEVRTVDGTDYFAVRRVAAEVVDAIRAGAGPALLHASVTRPYSHSSADTQSKYRSAADLAAEAAHDPVARLEAELVDAGLLTEDAAAALREDVHREVAAAAAEALAAPRPDPASATDQVWALPDLGSGPEAPAADATADEPAVAMGEAIRLALHEQLATDPRVLVFGEDVADAPPDVLAEVEGKGGVFGITAGLQRTFGPERCFNTPLAEAGIIGRGVGLALRGLRPCPEIQFFDYIWPAMQQLKSEAATVRWRSNGAFTCPMVVRVAIGGYLTGGAIWHSQSGESIFAHVPGLLIAFPSRARDAVGLLPRRVPGRRPGAVLRAQAPAAPALHRRPLPRRGLRHPVRAGRRATPGRRPHAGHLGRHRREEPPGGGPGGVPPRRRDRGDRPAHHRALGP